MSVVASLALMAAQAVPSPEFNTMMNQWDQGGAPTPEPKRLGAGPHTLVIADRSAMTKINYKSGAACERARDAARKQLGITTIRTFCVPR